MECKYHIDSKVYRVKPTESYIRVEGWCFDCNKEKIDFYANVDNKKIIPEKHIFLRNDVKLKYKDKYNISENSGFMLKSNIIIQKYLKKLRYM